jgi:hypothetical protein
MHSHISCCPQIDYDANATGGEHEQECHEAEADAHAQREALLDAWHQAHPGNHDDDDALEREDPPNAPPRRAHSQK